MYPELSNRPMKKNNSTICGRNTTTPPTPPKTPSTNRERKSPAGISDSTQAATAPWADSIQPIGIRAKENIPQNTANMMARNATHPHTRCSSQTSRRSDNVS